MGKVRKAINKRKTKIHLPFLYAVNNTIDKFKGPLASALETEHLNFLSECVRHLIANPAAFNLPHETIKRLGETLKPEQKQWKRFCNPKSSSACRRKILRQQTGGGFGLILATLIPSLIGTIVDAVT